MTVIFSDDPEYYYEIFVNLGKNYISSIAYNQQNINV